MSINVLEKRLARERAARAEAERLLESKSAELFAANEDLRKTAAELECQSTELSAIFNSALSGFCLADSTRKIMRANAYAYRILGYEPGELIGQELQDLFDLKYVQSVQAFGVEKTTLCGKAGDEIYAKTKAGNPVPLEVSASEVFLGEQRCTLWNFHDISCRKKKEAEKQILEEELRQAQKLESLGILASGVAHEINTPVQFVGDNLNFLAEAFDGLYATHHQKEEAVDRAGACEEIEQNAPNAPDDDEASFLLESVPDAITQSLEGIARIAEIVAAVREFSHPGTKEKTPLDLNKAIESTITLSSNHWKYVADIETEFDNGLPEVHCVPGQFNQAILNLIVNAAHAIEAQQQNDKGKIQISTALTQDEAEVCVRDNGTGIPEDIQGKIYDPFFTTKEVGKGTGQGLSLVHTIVVAKHGGRVFFETSPGAGTAFYLRWPVQPKDAVCSAA